MKTSFFAKSIALLILVVMVSSLVFAGCDLGDLQSRVVDPSGEVASAEYSAVFEGTGLSHKIAAAGENTVSYAKIDEDGFIYCQDYAYKGDTITQWVVTDYIPVHGFDSELMADMEAACEEDLAPFEGYACVDAGYTVDGDYITFTVKFNNTDEKETLEAMSELGYVDSTDGYFSMEECEKIDLGDGYVKK